MEAGTSSGRMVSDEEMGSLLQETRPRVRKGKGGGRRIVSSNEEEESATYDDEPSWKEKQRGSHGKQARKRKNKEKVRNRRTKDDEQIDLTRDEGLHKEDVEETDERRRQEVGKDRIMRGAKIEAKYEYELKRMSSQEIKDHAIMLIEDVETVRLKMKNMQGGLSGILKDRLLGLRNVIECLIDKLEEKGDVTFFKTKNNELLAENKRLKKEGEKWEHERTQKDKEIESYREMYEDAENRYVDAEKRIRIKEKEKAENELAERYLGKDSVRKEKAGVSRMKIGSRSLEDKEDIENAEEDLRRKKVLEDQTWPVIRPHIQGISRILITPGRRKTPMDSALMEVDPVMVQETRELVSVPAERIPGMTDEPEKRKKNQISKEEEIEKLNRQIKILAEERKKLRESRTPQKGRPRVISNIQIVSPRGDVRDAVAQERQQEGEWTRVIGRRDNTRRADFERTGIGKRERSRSGTRQRRPPRTAVVAIRARNENVSYAEVLRKARQGISLGELRIETTKVKRGINGSLLIEIPGQEGSEKARVLTEKLKEKLDENEVMITRPTAMAEIKVTGLDESVTIEEMRETIAHYGGCTTEEVKTGNIRWMYNGLGIIWIRCPLAAAIKVEKEGKIRIGWTVAKVEVMAKRPLQCYRCWEFGHVRFSCKAKVDRKGHCFNCGNLGHSARECRSEVPRCVICDERGYPANHRIGSRFCRMSKTLERKEQPFGGNAIKDTEEKEIFKEKRIEGAEEEDRMECNDEL